MLQRIGLAASLVLLTVTKLPAQALPGHDFDGRPSMDPTVGDNEMTLGNNEGRYVSTTFGNSPIPYGNAGSSTNVCGGQTR